MQSHKKPQTGDTPMTSLPHTHTHTHTHTPQAGRCQGHPVPLAPLETRKRFCPRTASLPKVVYAGCRKAGLSEIGNSFRSCGRCRRYLCYFISSEIGNTYHITFQGNWCRKESVPLGLSEIGTSFRPSWRHHPMSEIGNRASGFRDVIIPRQKSETASGLHDVIIS